MTLIHVSQSGNICIPKSWRDELGILPNTTVILEKEDGTIRIEPIKKNGSDAFHEIDEEIKKKRIRFTQEEVLQHDYYDIH